MSSILKQYHYLYKITNLINNKIYIGIHSTDKVSDGYFGSGKTLKAAIRKYGKTYFTKEILEWFDWHCEALLAESLIVNKEFIERSDTYNLICGGAGGYYDVNTPEELRTIRSLNSTGSNNPMYGLNYNWYNNGIRQIKVFTNDKIPSGYSIGIIKTPKVLARQQNLTGYIHSYNPITNKQTFSKVIPEGNIAGMTDNTKLNISSGQKTYWNTMSDSMYNQYCINKKTSYKGYIVKDETRIKMQKSRLAYWSDPLKHSIASELLSRKYTSGKMSAKNELNSNAKSIIIFGIRFNLIKYALEFFGVSAITLHRHKNNNKELYSVIDYTDNNIIELEKRKQDFFLLKDKQFQNNISKNYVALDVLFDCSIKVLREFFKSSFKDIQKIFKLQQNVGYKKIFSELTADELILLKKEIKLTKQTYKNAIFNKTHINKLNKLNIGKKWFHHKETNKRKFDFEYNIDLTIYNRGM